MRRSPFVVISNCTVEDAKTTLLDALAVGALLGVRQAAQNTVSGVDTGEKCHWHTMPYLGKITVQSVTASRFNGTES